MKHLGLAAVLVVGVSVPAFAQGTAPGTATAVTLGEAVVRKQPDRAVVTFSTETRAATAQEAQAKGAAAMKSMQAAMEGLRVTGMQVTTTGLYLNADYEFANNQRTMRGYVDRHTVAVRFDDIARAGEVLAVAVSAGANAINGIRFDRRDRETLEQQALKQAVQVAMARAEALAAGAGRSVDHIVRIAEAQAAALDGSPAYRTELVALQSQNASVIGGPPVAAGEVEVRARVVLTVALK